VYRSLLRRRHDLQMILDNTRSLSAGQEEVIQPQLLHPDIKHTAQELFTLLELFDSIIQEEYVPNHDKLPTVLSEAPQVAEMFRSRAPSRRKPKLSSQVLCEEPVSCNFSCDFCGCDIFQSFFECSRCALPGEEHVETFSSTLGDGLTICPSCYVEGRTCACGSMLAAQCRPFNTLYQARNDAVRVLRRFGGEYSRLSLFEK
jgi:hypothetical protein